LAAVLTEQLGQMTFNSLTGIRFRKLMRYGDDNRRHK